MTASEYKKTYVPSEDEEQTAVMDYCLAMQGKYPELELMYHIANEGKRGRHYASLQKRIGLKAGVPDLCLPIARKGFHGLYIELKALDGRISPKQKEWIAKLNEQGYKAVFCFGADAAIEVIADYLK